MELWLHTYFIEARRECSGLPAISFSIYGVNLKCRPVIALNKRRQCMTSSFPLREKCVIYGPEIILGKRHMIKLAAVTINFIWQGPSLIQVSTSYHKGSIMLTASSLLKFPNKKENRKSRIEPTMQQFFFLCVFTFYFRYLLVYYANLLTNYNHKTRCNTNQLIESSLFRHTSLIPWQKMRYLPKLIRLLLSLPFHWQ